MKLLLKKDAEETAEYKFIDNIHKEYIQEKRIVSKHAEELKAKKSNI